MASFTKVMGLVALEKKLKRLPDVAKDEIKKEIAAGAEAIVAMAKSLVPVDNGDLRDSIGWTFGKAPKGSLTLGKIAAAQVGGELTATVYAGNDEVFWARWVEFGVAPHSTAQGADISRNKRQGGDKQHPGSRAQPFFFPSYRANKKQIVRKIRAAQRRAAKMVAKGS